MWTYYSGGPFETKHFRISTDIELAEGHSGVVFTNKFDPSKLIKKSGSDDLIDEYAIGRKIDHPNFMKVYRLFKKVYVNESGNKVDWKYKLEIERIFGEALGNTLARQKVDQIFYLKLTEAMCNGLVYLDHQKIAWADVSLDNIMIREDGAIKFIDFGLYSEEADDAKRIKRILKNYHNLVWDIMKNHRMSEDAEEINKHIENLLINKRKELKDGASPEQTLSSFLDSIKLYIHKL